ncbi:MAG: hypothetical protein ACJ8LG_23350 [Massilia sp.]
MRNPLILLAPVLLAGCVNESASYYIDGNEHTLNLRARQDHFWSKQVTLRLVAAHLPECQRQFVLGETPLADLDVELFASGDQVYTLRAGQQVWQVETQGCTQLAPPAQLTGEPLGAFRLDESGKKLVFEKAAATATARQ